MTVSMAGLSVSSTLLLCLVGCTSRIVSPAKALVVLASSIVITLGAS